MNPLYQKNFDALQLGLAIVSVDGTIRSCNEAFRAMIGYQGDDPAGRSLADLLPGQCDALLRVYQTAAAEKRAVRETRIPCAFADGSVRYFNLQARPLYSREQPVILISLWDITSTEQARHHAVRSSTKASSQMEEMFRNRLLLRALMDHVPEGVAVTDIAANRITWVSRYGCELLGVSREQLQKIPLDQLPDSLHLYHLDGETRAVGDEMPLLRASYQVIRDEEWILRQPGRPAVYVVINAGPILDSEGAMIGSVIVWHDMTRQHQAEQQARDYAEQLERSNRDLQDFASVVSHDLQEPLRKVRLFGNMLKERYLDQLTEEGRDFIERMQNAAERMQQMIDNLLTFSRVSTHTREYTAVDLKQVVADVLVDLEGRLKESGGTVEVGALPVIQADAMQMQQLFQNLISNALKYHRPDVPPVVRIHSAGTSRRYAEIRVQDNGIGFDTNYLDYVFKPFSRLHGSSSYEGTGIGLAICRRIVERHKGTITATSTPGEGSTFIVRLPWR